MKHTSGRAKLMTALKSNSTERLLAARRERHVSQFLQLKFLMPIYEPRRAFRNRHFGSRRKMQHENIHC